MKTDDQWAIEEKKERRRWFWTFVVLMLVIVGFSSSTYYNKYSATTLITVLDRVRDDFSMESYNKGTISLKNLDDVNLNKNNIELSEDEISDLMILLQQTPIKGIKRNDYFEINRNTYYIVDLEADSYFDNPSIAFFIGRDELTGEIVLSLMENGYSIPDGYIAENEDLYNVIFDLVDKSNKNSKTLQNN